MSYRRMGLWHDYWLQCMVTSSSNGRISRLEHVVRFNVELSAKMTYEDEFRNFIGRDHFETYQMKENTTVHIVKNTLMVVI